MRAFGRRSRRRFQTGLILALSAHVLLTDLVSPAFRREAPAPPARAAAAAPPETGPALEPQQPISEHLAAGRARRHPLRLQPGQYSRLSVTPDGVGLRATLRDAGGRPLVQTACRWHGAFQFFWVAESAGEHWLEVDACEAEPAVGGYALTLEESRPAAEQDGARVVAQQLTFEAERLRAGLDIEAERAAARKYEEAAGAWRAAGDGAAEAAALRALGEMLQEHGERLVALRRFEEAAARGRAAKDFREERRALNHSGFLRAVMGDYQQALSVSSRVLDASRRSGDPANEAQALSNLGWVFYETGKLAPALEHQRKALGLWRELKDRRGEAHALLRIGYVNVLLGETQEARDAYLRALPLFRAVEDQRGRALVLAALGHLHSMTGDKQEALNRYNEALALSRRMEHSELAAQLSGGLGYVYFELGEFDQALHFYEQTLALYRAMPDRWGEAAVHLSIGMVSHAKGEARRALDHYERGLRLARALPNARLEASFLRETGAVHEGQGRRREAVAFYRRALALSRSGDNPRCEAQVLNHLGRAYRALGREEEALGFFDAALPLTRAVGDKFTESQTLFNAAQVGRDLGRLDAARGQIREATRLVESLRTNVTSHSLRTSYFATVRQQYDLHIDVLMRLHGERPAEGFAAEAVEVSERARARSLLETLHEARADIRQGVDPSLSERERALQQELDAKAERLMTLRSGPHTAEEVAAVAAEIDRLTREYDSVNAQIRATSPRYAALMQPLPLSLADVQRQVLDRDTLLLHYALGDERSYLWVVTKHDLTPYELPARAAIEDSARRLYNLLTTRQTSRDEADEHARARVAAADAQAEREAAALSRLVLEPAATRLAGKRLLVVPDGALQYINFGALPAPPPATGNVSAGRPLMLEHEVVSLPSASVLAALRSETAHRRPAEKSVAVLADPVFEKDDPRLPNAGGRPADEARTAELRSRLRDADIFNGRGVFPRLLSSREEAEAIIGVAPSGLKAIGFEASRATATGPELSKYRIVHFATHGVLNSERPELSGIVLSLFDERGRPQNGFLRLPDIYNLNLPADLVVLSACDTGLGKDVKGEGLVGLTRGFMYAGAAGVVSSLWKVDDEATAVLMKHFYRGVLEEGLSPAAALRAAQKRMWEQERWRSPYFWAAFTLQGEYRASAVPFNRRQGSLGLDAWATAGAGLLLLSCGGLFWRRRRRRRGN